MLQPIMLVAALSSPSPPPPTCPIVLGLLDGTIASDDAVEQLAGFGQHAIDDVIEALSDRPVGSTAVYLLEALTHDRDSRSHQVIRHYLYHPEPKIAALATRAFALAASGRSRRTLEHLLVSHRSYEQTLAALEGLARLRLPVSYEPIAEFASDSTNDPILRAEALTVLSILDPKKTRKWLKKRSKKEANLSPYLEAHILVVTADLAQR